MPDPDDADRMTYWRVESTNASGSKRELRPWPAEVRWAPLRPAYPAGLNAAERRDWSQRWYDEEYFGWKEEVIAAIAADPQATADEFARSAPAADLPKLVRKRPRVRVRPKAMSAKQRQIAAERLMAEALRRAGLSQRQVAGELGLPKTTVNRRLGAPGAIADGLAHVFLEVRVEQLMTLILEAIETATPEDLPSLRKRLDAIRRLQAVAAGAPAEVCNSKPSSVPFGLPPIGGGW